MHDTRHIKVMMIIYNRVGQMLLKSLVHEQNADSWGLHLHYLSELYWDENVINITSSEGFRFAINMDTAEIIKNDDNRFACIDHYWEYA